MGPAGGPEVGKLVEGRRARRFRAHCIGLPKTGTTSIGTIFENYRSAKVAGSSLERVGCDLRDDPRTAEAARAFVLQRDDEEWLEMDPSSANWMILEILKEQFPESRFILTIRDCYSWCDSLLNVLIGRTPGNDFIESPELFTRMLGCQLDWFRDAENVLSHREPIFENLLRLWVEQATTSRECPASRTLVIKTNDISSSLEVIAAFVGVPTEMLLPERTHSRQTARKFDILRRSDRNFLEAVFRPYADSAFMRDYFPDVTLAGFLGSDGGSRTLGARKAHAPVAELRDRLIRDTYPVGYWLSEATAAASGGDVAAAERSLTEALRQPLEPDERSRAGAIRAMIERSDDSFRAVERYATSSPPSGPGNLEADPLSRAPSQSAMTTEPPIGQAEITQALAVIRAYSARGMPERLGYRLEKYALRARDGAYYGLLLFAGSRRALVLEIRLRDVHGNHWLASERFAISYRRSTAAMVQADLQLAQALLNAVEHDVGRLETDGSTHEHE